MRVKQQPPTHGSDDDTSKEVDPKNFTFEELASARTTLSVPIMVRDDLKIIAALEQIPLSELITRLLFNHIRSYAGGSHKKLFASLKAKNPPS